MAVCKWEYNVHFPGGCQGFATSSTHPRRARVKTCLCPAMRWRDNKGFKVTHPKQIYGADYLGPPWPFQVAIHTSWHKQEKKLNFLMPCHNNPLSEISVDSVNFFLNNPLISPMYFEKREKRGGQTRLYMYFPFLIFSCNWRLLLFLRVSITGKVLFNYLYISQLQQQ